MLKSNEKMTRVGAEALAEHEQPPPSGAESAPIKGVGRDSAHAESCSAIGVSPKRIGGSPRRSQDDVQSKPRNNFVNVGALDITVKGAPQGEESKELSGISIPLKQFAHKRGTLQSSDSPRKGVPKNCSLSPTPKRSDMQSTPLTGSAGTNAAEKQSGPKKSGAS